MEMEMEMEMGGGRFEATRGERELTKGALYFLLALPSPFSVLCLIFALTSCPPPFLFFPEIGIQHRARQMTP